MSQRKPPKKKVVVTTSTPEKSTVPTVKRSRRSSAAAPRQIQQDLILGRQNYILMGAGAVLILLGLALMSGGHMPSPDVWDENIIYSFRRITLAPIVILAGLALEIFAIFKK